ncbi:extracellular solute-binding protein family 1 [Thermoclostridium stercorarium subsp. stercorarium DSM 8532]|jgi:raffinose/stachyose/melibiose transport system substrate-binding protein|uniref:Extracellular solute-binding protein family 1 n=3 Tax=Thermoclostridium stercorarium TaxID=1510 RepID=L7VLV4_THES1|nr:extracellular solute-binding protein [Thermoclostridium stercorarium]AGC67491.1 extracellular solute-binding protein family 1 [Thermoclostridium stercorarium subsp. stercorarium DSM 8532]AGI38546.1 ABC transporter periplasmic subunit [Thermoclostridium stercorarium subsp. stercorarium DSM 8532]ANW97919.1 ABC transporter substrate-binding protein [Thermoclostridium stercorarium subsp. thermolacticum DSM 2910]ANX00469.1 ABC transporter substrate-binding protein [Thermoclostridium stercorarium 
MKTKLRKLLAFITAILMTFSLAGCSTGDTNTSRSGTNTNTKNNTTDSESLRGTTIRVFTHMGQRVLGEEKKDDQGNTYRDESTAILKHLAERFTKETGINVELNVVTNEEELRPYFQVQDDYVDVYTCPNWSLEEWKAYAEPYCTLEEGIELYGEYAKAMPNVDGYIYSIMPGRAYNQAVVYNEEVIKAAGYNEIPATLEKFNEMCEKIKAMGIIPIVLHRVENWPLATVQDFAIYVSGNPTVFAECLKTENPFSDTSPFGKTIKMYTEWKAKGFFEPEVFPDFGAAMDSVAYGRAAMMLFGSWVVPQIQGRVPKGKDPSIIKFAPAPDFGAGRYVLAAPADNWAISKFSKNKEAARMFIEYIANDSQFIADSGFIANKKGVKPIVPELYAIIDEMVEKGECKVILQPPNDENALNNQKVLEEAGLYADYKYVGLLFDALDITKPDDWSEYYKQAETLNQLYARYKNELGVEWKD